METANYLITRNNMPVRLGTTITGLAECKKLEPDRAYIIGRDPISAVGKLISNEGLLKRILEIGKKSDMNDVKGIVIPQYMKEVSKAHTMIFQKDGEAYIVDLDSKFGTLVNNERIQNLTQIRAMDYINIGPIEMEIARMPNYSRKKAMIIGSDIAKNLSGVMPDCNGIEKLLLSREFKPENIEKLVYDKYGIIKGKPTRLNIIKILENFKKTQNEESLTVLYYSGHGAEDGSFILPPWDTLDRDYAFLSDFDPYDFHDDVKRIPGYKLIIADSCYSGKIKEFFKKNPIPKTTVIASAKPNQEAYESESIGRFTREFLKQAAKQTIIKPGVIADLVNTGIQEKTMIITDPVVF